MGQLSRFIFQGASGFVLLLGSAIGTFGAVPLSPQVPPAGATVPPGGAATTQPATPTMLDVSALHFTTLLGDPRFRHGGEITTLAPGRNAQEIMSAGLDGSVRFWDRATGKEVGRYHQELSRKVSHALLLPDGRRVVTCCSGEGRIRLWDLESGKMTWSIDQVPDSADWLALTPDGKSVLVASGDRTIREYDLGTGNKIREFPGCGYMYPNMLALSPDGKMLAGPGPKADVLLWDLSADRAPQSLDLRFTGLEALAFSATGKLGLVVKDHSVRLWDPPNGTQLWKVTFTGNPGRLAFSPDGKTLAVSCEDRKIHLLDSATGREFRQLILPLPGSNGPVTFSPDGQEIWAANLELICRYDAATGQRLFPLAEADPLMAFGGTKLLAVSADGRRLYSTGGSTGIFIWDLARGTLQDIWTTPRYGTSLALSADGQRLLVGAQQGFVLDSSNGKVLNQFDFLAQGIEPEWYWALGDHAAVVASQGSTLRVYKVNGSVQTISSNEPTGGEDNGRSHILTVSPDGRLVVMRTDATTRFWSVPAEKVLGTLDLKPIENQPQPEAIVLARWVSPGAGAGAGAGPRLLTWSYTGPLRYWQASGAPAPGAPRAPAPILSREILAGWVKDLGDQDFQVREQATSHLIDAGNVAELVLAKADLKDPEVAERAKQIVSAVGKRQIPDQEVGQPLQYGVVSALAIHPDGQHWAALVGIGGTREIVLGELTEAGPRELRRLPDEYVPEALIFTRDGRTLYVGNDNATISVYGLP